MESTNYTYEEVYGHCETFGYYTEFNIVNRDGDVIATAVDEDSATLIVAALNGVAL